MFSLINPEPQQGQRAGAAGLERGVEGGRRLVGQKARGPATALHGGVHLFEGWQDVAESAGNQHTLGRAKLQPAFPAGVSSCLNPDLRLEVRVQSVLIRG